MTVVVVVVVGGSDVEDRGGVWFLWNFRHRLPPPTWELRLYLWKVGPSLAFIQAKAMQEYTVAMEMEKVVKYRKKFKLVPIPGTGSRKLEIWLQYNVGHLLINPREAEKIAGSQAQEVYEYFMVVRHPVDRLVSLCREYQPLVLEPNQCI